MDCVSVVRLQSQPRNSGSTPSRCSAVMWSSRLWPDRIDNIGVPRRREPRAHSGCWRSADSHRPMPRTLPTPLRQAPRTSRHARCRILPEPRRDTSDSRPSGPPGTLWSGRGADEQAEIEPCKGCSSSRRLWRRLSLMRPARGRPAQVRGTMGREDYARPVPLTTRGRGDLPLRRRCHGGTPERRR